MFLTRAFSGFHDKHEPITERDIERTSGDLADITEHEDTDYGISNDAIVDEGLSIGGRTL